jgi:hypothetical protein
MNPKPGAPSRHQSNQTLNPQPSILNPQPSTPSLNLEAHGATNPTIVAETAKAFQAHVSCVARIAFYGLGLLGFVIAIALLGLGFRV